MYASSQLDRTIALAKLALQMAESEREEKEREKNVATWAGRVLFAFGWGLGLVGRLYGDEKEAPETV
jgi:hypothetical protein